MFRIIHTLFFLFLAVVLLPAQQNQYHWRLGVHGGLMNYYGDLSYKFWDTNSRLNELTDNLDYLSYGFSLEKSLSQAWAMRLLLTDGEFIANDRIIKGDGKLLTGNPNIRRALNARTEITDISLLFNYHFDNDLFFGKDALIAPYLTAGIGWSDFKVSGDLFTRDGQRYYYWSDNTVRDVAEASGQTGVIILQDGVFETNLNKLDTEGEDYRTDLVHLSAGLGIKFRLSNRLNLNLETVFRFTNTDYLDDVSGRYLRSYDNELQAYAANPAGLEKEFRGDPDGKNDIYSVSSLSLHYNFGRKSRAFRSPVVRTGFLPYREEMPAPDTEATLTEASKEMSSLDTTMAEVPDSTVAMTGADSLFAGMNKISRQIDTLTAKIVGKKPLVSDEGELAARLDSLEERVRQLEQQQTVFQDSIRDKSYKEVEKLQIQPAVIAPARADTLAENKEKAVAISSSTDTIVKVVERQLTTPGKRDTIVNVIEQPAAEAAPTAFSEAELEQLKQQLDELQQALRDVDKEPEARSRSNAQLQEIQRLEEQLNRQEALLKEGQNDLESYEALQSSITALRLDILRNNMPASESDISLRARNDSLQQEINRLTAEVGKLNTAVRRLEQAVQGDTLQLIMPNTDLSRLSRQVDSLESQLLSVQQGKGAEVRRQEEQISGLDDKVEGLELQVEFLQRQLTEVEAGPAIAADATSLLKQKIAGSERQRVFFATGSATLDLAARQTVGGVAGLMKTHDRLLVRITGYTDTSGNPVSNKVLADKRAQAVAGYLKQQGIPAQRITLNGAGEDPKAEPAFGRRVELLLEIGE